MTHTPFHGPSGAGGSFDPTPLRALVEEVSKRKSVQSAADKWRGLAATNPNPEALRALMAMDARRIAAGNKPYSGTQSALMLAQAQSAKPLLPEPNRGFLKRMGMDLRNLVRGVVDLPKMLWREAKAIPTIPAKLATAISEGGANPLRMLGNIAGDVPVARLLPGAYIAENIGKGTPGQLWEHPLYTLLDVVDAGTVGTRLATGKPVRAHLPAVTRKATGAIERRFPTVKLGTPEHPLGFLLSKGKLGAKGGVGPFARAAARSVAESNLLLRSAFDRRARKFRKAAKGIAPERRAQLYELATKGSLDEAATDAARARWKESLEPNERNLVDIIEKQNQQLARSYVARGEAFEWRGELYPINKRTQKMAGAVATVNRINHRLAELRRTAAAHGGATLTAGQVNLDKLLKAKQAAIDVADSYTNIVPARFQPLIEQRVMDAVRDTATKQQVSPANVERLLHYIELNQLDQLKSITDNVGNPVFDADVFQTLRNDIARTWTDAKRAGFDPLFVHKVTRRDVRSLSVPSIIPEGGPKPAATLERSITGGGEHVSDLVLSAEHQFLEWLQPRFTGHAFNMMRKAGIAKRATDVEQQVIARSLQVAEIQRSRGIEPNLKRIRESLADEWVRYEPEKHMIAQPMPLRAFPDEWVVPRSVAAALDHAASKPGFFMGLLRRPMRMFRMSVLTLSPNYYLANIIGDSVLAMVRTDPSVLLYYGKAIRALRTGKIDPKLPRGVTDMPVEARQWSIDDGGRVAEWFYNKTGKDVSKVQRLAEWINDATRLTAYLHQLDKASKGKAKWVTGERVSTAPVKRAGQGSRWAEKVSGTKSEARRFALEQQNRIFQNWGTMTPVERTAIRSVFPFYSWTRFVLRNTFSFPFDHPVRASVLLNFTSSELADQPEVERLRNTIFFGGSEDTKHGVPMGTINPFADVGNVFTLGGFMSKFNPFLSASLESLGVDPFTATPQQFGLASQYDPRTGRVIAAPQGLLRNFIGNISPQAGGLIDIVNPSEDIQRLKVLNPQAYKRHILGSFGMRAIPTAYSMPEERGREAIARLDALRKSLGRSGEGVTYPRSAEPLLTMLARERTGL